MNDFWNHIEALNRQSPRACADCGVVHGEPVDVGKVRRRLKLANVAPRLRVGDLMVPSNAALLCDKCAKAAAPVKPRNAKRAAPVQPKRKDAFEQIPLFAE